MLASHEPGIEHYTALSWSCAKPGVQNGAKSEAALPKSTLKGFCFSGQVVSWIRACR